MNDKLFNKIIIVICAVLLISIMVIRLFIVKSKKISKKQTIRKISMIGLLSALSVALYFLKFPLPIFASFLEINFANLPVLLASFMFGPIEGILIALVRTLIKIPFTSSYCVGEIQDFIIAATISLITGFIYQKNKSKKGAIISLIIASVSWIGIALLCNAFVTIPVYIKVMKFPVEEMAKLVPGSSVDTFLRDYLLLSCLPFNLLLSFLVSLITFFVYKKTSNLFKGFISKASEEDINN